MTYDEQYALEKKEWEAKHPGQDYEEYVDGIVTSKEGDN